MSRVDELRKLLDQYGHTPEDYDEGEEEDPRPYFNGEREPDRYACVTINYSSRGEGHYFFLTLSSLEDAQHRAGEYANDDLFEEQPIAVVDLDTGRRWIPQIETSWEEVILNG